MERSVLLKGTLAGAWAQTYNQPGATTNLGPGFGRPPQQGVSTRTASEPCDQ